MQTVRDILDAAGFDMTHYHEESVQAPIRVEEQIPEHDDVMPEAGAAAIIGFSLSGIEAQCQETDTIIEVARASGLNIPSACQFGVCGTCKIRKLKGEGPMVHTGGIPARHIDPGYNLACCSRPLGTVNVWV